VRPTNQEAKLTAGTSSKTEKELVQTQQRIRAVCEPSWRQRTNKNWKKGQNVNESVQTGTELNE